MQLSRQTLRNIKPRAGLIVPAESILDLPEKVIQFGTGVLLRGLPDYFIDKANRQGIFNGRIVVVKSTSQGGTDSFKKQDGLYTLCVKGIEEGRNIEETVINSSISRVLSAKEEWEKILACAHNPAIQIIISNTTEVGITLSDDEVLMSPPNTFPGKLLAFLLERFKAFKGSEQHGMVIIPTELIIDNGSKLRSIVLELAHKNNLETGFISWLAHSNYFCNSLVDRIVPGKLADADRVATESQFGYTDDLMIMAETFRFWAIESGDETVKKILSFTAADPGVVIAPGIEKFRELKLRLLNGSHTFSCGLAHLAGFNTVREAMEDESMFLFIRDLILQEIAPAVSNGMISLEEAREFGRKVLDRYRNPFLEHKWISIAVQYYSKMKMRNIPLLLRHYAGTDRPPARMVMGFAAFLLFMKGEKTSDGSFKGTALGEPYSIEDAEASYFSDKWKKHNANDLVEEILMDKNFWGMDLSTLNGFTDGVKTDLGILMQEGAMAGLRRLQLNKEKVR